MNLPDYCARVEAKIKNHLVQNPESMGDEDLIDTIQKIIARHHVPFVALRAFAAIYLYEKARHKGATREIINRILIYKTTEGVIAKHDIAQELNRLKSNTIIKSQGDQLLLAE